MKLLLAITFLILSGCAYSVVVKDCYEVKYSNKYVCKTIKPWE